MYAIETLPEFLRALESIHPRRFKVISLKVMALQTNPRPPECEMIDPETYMVRAGPYKIAYTIDDTRRRIKVYALEEKPIE
jgi:mRNA-degrading endonuclease RelE of RelBE toxin-antitoxin system